MSASARARPWAALILAALPSRTFYAEVAWRWTGFGVVWLHLLVGLGWIPVTAVSIGRIDRQAAAIDAALVGAPRVLIWEGSAQVRGEQPWVFRGPEGQPWAVVDGRGQITSLEGRQERVLIGRDALVLGRVRVPWDALPALMVDEELARTMAADLGRWARWVVYPAGVAADVTWRAGLALVFGGVVAWRRRALGAAPLPLPALSRLGVMCGVGPFWAGIAARTAGVELPLETVLALGWGGVMADFAARVSVDPGGHAG